MNRYLFSIICLATFGLQAADFSHKITITSKTSESGQVEYLAKILVEKKLDEQSALFTIASPELVCVEGETSKLEIVSEDKADELIVTVLVSKENDKSKAKATVHLKDANKVVISSEEEIEIKS
ncbi:MAG TPA: hypothetical protein VMR37_00690 [Rhabdochlamydiaceae bacterium]|jgi:hypothetical protein|nr:hypothetical protein [Rhabdochlamydiaceae bacterium]